MEQEFYCKPCDKSFDYAMDIGGHNMCPECQSQYIILRDKNTSTQRSFSRGKLGIAGNMVMEQFEREARRAVRSTQSARPVVQIMRDVMNIIESSTDKTQADMINKRLEHVMSYINVLEDNFNNVKQDVHEILDQYPKKAEEDPRAMYTGKRMVDLTLEMIRDDILKL